MKILLFAAIKEYLSSKKNHCKMYFHKARWKKMNKHNNTIANTLFDVSLVKVGKGSYGHLNVHSYGNKDEGLVIGNYCSIAGNVHFILSGGHDYLNFSTYPFYAMNDSRVIEATTKGRIIIEDDVWIGYGSIILSGVNIGRGAVIAAGSIVTRDVPPYAVWINNKVYKYRFSQDTIDKLMNIDYSSLDPIRIINNNLNVHIDETNIDEILSKISDKQSIK